MSCISSVRSSSPVPSSRLNNVFKARSAKLKKYLMDLSGTSGAILLTSLKQALAANNFLLTNYNEVLQFVQKFKHRVKVDLVMQWLKLESIDNRDRIIATLVIPRNMSTIDTFMASQTDFRKDSLTPQAPSHVRPSAPVHSRANSVNLNNSLNNSQNNGDDYLLERLIERNINADPQPPVPTNDLLRRHRPASVGGPRIGLEHRRNSPSSVMLGGPHLNLSGLMNGQEEKSSQKAKSVYKLNISLQCEYSCASTKNENESVMGDNLSMAMNMSPQKLDFMNPGKANKAPQIQQNEQVDRSNSPVKEKRQNYDASNRVSQIAVKGDVNTANVSVRDKQTHDDILLELTHDLQKRQVKYEYIFGMLKTAMKLAQRDNVKSVPREAYEESAAGLQPMLGPDLYRRLIDFSLDNQGRVSPELLSLFVDHFKYAPYLVKHFKNSSDQFQQLALFGPRDEGNQEKVYYNLKMLGKRIEEKFMKLGKAYRFFDLDKSGYIELPQFKHGLDLLGMRLPDTEVKDLFDHLDRKQDGIIDFDEFCDILEERRIVKGIKANHDVVANEVEKQKPMRGSTNYSPYIPMIRPDIRDDPRMVDLRKETNETLGPEYVSEQQKKCIIRNPSYRKAPVGSVKKFYTPESTVRDVDLRHGVRSQASECMKDVMANNFQREWQEKAKERERKRVEEDEKRRTRPKKMFNDATILRNEFIKKIYERVHKDDNEAQWKMSKFSNVGPKVSASRKERFNKSSLNNSLNYSSHRTNDHDGNLNISVL